jgi:hypothetical protein
MIRIKFNEDLLTRTKVKRNILSIYNQALSNERNDWYKDAHNWAKGFVLTDTDFNRFCGIVSALSPLKKWEENKSMAVNYWISGGHIPHIRQFAQKAVDICNSDGENATVLRILRGAKICSFYNNIRYPNAGNVVTVDRHALSIAIGRFMHNHEQGLTKNQYEFFRHCYVWTANELEISPQYLQGVTWSAWRRLKTNYK